MTKDEFEALYVENGGVTIEWLREFGWVAAPCDCGEECCQGWRMMHRDEEDQSE